MKTIWVQQLLDWFKANQRRCRRDLDTPYTTWISEIMLQQTQVDTVIPYFNRFIESFPTVEVLASSDLQVVLKHWEGLDIILGPETFIKPLNYWSRIINQTYPKVIKKYKPFQALAPIVRLPSPVSRMETLFP